MLGRLEQEQWLGTLAIDVRTHGHANGEGIASNEAAHDPHSLGKIHEHDVIRLGWRPRMDDGRRVNRARSARLNPLPLHVAGPRLRNSWREETAPTPARSLQAQLAPSQCFSPLLLRSHRAKLCAAK